MTYQESDREISIAKEMRTCRHFNGLGLGGHYDKTCAAGVNYRELVGGDVTGWALAVPCLGGLFAEKRDRPMVPCAGYAPPSREEAEWIVDERTAHTAEILRRLGAGEDVPGVIVCGKRTEPEGKECPASDDGKCPECGVSVEASYGLGSGYGGIGGYSFCTKCGTVYDFVEDRE